MDDLVSHGLWAAALVAYSRCFGTGVRTWFDESIFGGEEDVLREHRYYKNIREKHLAHSVSSFESFASGIEVFGYAGDDPWVHRAVTLYLTRAIEPGGKIQYLVSSPRGYRGLHTKGTAMHCVKFSTEPSP